MPIEPRDDGLAIPEVGRWAKRKYHFLERYLTLFSTGMKNRWPERHYIDLFAGAGFARIKGTGEIVASSAIIAARMPDPFTAIHLCERDPQLFDALTTRTRETNTSSKIFPIQGDANDNISKILQNVPRRNALCITFADPFGLHLKWETIEQISQARSDLIILLADNMDALRNWSTYYHNNPNSNLDQFMGEPGWRGVLMHSSKENAAQRLRERYQQRLGSLGYKYFDSERVSNDQGHDIYSLVFATKHERGLEFWTKARSVDEGGQRNLLFGS